MQARAFRFIAVQLLGLFAVLPACSTTQEPSPAPISSTRGMTLARTGTVIDVRSLSAAAQADASQQITVQFDDGHIARYEVDQRPPLQAGERVTVSESLGKVRISR